MNETQNITSTAKNIGVSLLKSKWFWYSVIGVFVYKFLQKTFPNTFGAKPNELDLPKETKPTITDNWYQQIGEPLINDLYYALQKEYFVDWKRDDCYQRLLACTNAQIIFISNQYNKKYQRTTGKSLFKDINSQTTYISIFGTDWEAKIINKMISLGIK